MAIAPNKFRNIPINVHSSMVAYDPDCKDRNQYVNMQSEQEKRDLILKTLEKYWNQNLNLVNIKDGRIQPVFIGPSGPSMNAVAARCWITYMLFGEWRIATPEDIAKQAKIDEEISERNARLEAKRMAKAAGLMFREVSDAAGSIVRHNAAMNKEEEIAEALREPTDAELEKMQENLNAVKKAKAEKAKVEKKESKTA